MSEALNTNVNGSRGTCVAVADFLSGLYAGANTADGATRDARAKAEGGWTGPAQRACAESLSGVPGDLGLLADRSYQCEWALRGFDESLGKVLDLMGQALSRARTGGLWVDGPFIFAPQVPAGISGLPTKKCTPQDAQVAARNYQGEVADLRAAQADYNAKAKVYNECKTVVEDARRIEGRAHEQLQTTMKAVREATTNWGAIGVAGASLGLSYVGANENARRTALQTMERLNAQSKFLKDFANGTVAAASPLQERILQRSADLAEDAGKYEQRVAQFEKFISKVPENTRKTIVSYPGKGALEGRGAHAKTVVPHGATGLVRSLPFLGSTFTVVNESVGAMKGEQSWGRAAADSAATIGGGALGGMATGAALGSAFSLPGSVIGGIVGGVAGSKIATDIVAGFSGDGK